MKLSITLCCLLLSFSLFAEIKLATYNIRNFDYDVRSNTPTNKSQLVKTIKSINPDLMAVQEINNSYEFAHMIYDQFQSKYDVALSICGGAHDQKLGFIFDKDKIELLDFDEDGRISIPKDPSSTGCGQGSRPLAIGFFKNKQTNKKFVAIAVHLKSGGRNRSITKRFNQLELISVKLSELRAQGHNNFIIMGDFNSTEYILKGKIHSKFTQTISNMKMIDSTKNLECTSYWWGGNNDRKQYPSSLDHILVSPELLSNKQVSANAHGHCQQLKCQITRESQMGINFDEVSDHCPISTEIK